MEWKRSIRAFLGLKPETTGNLKIKELLDRYFDSIYNIALLKTGSIATAELLTRQIFEQTLLSLPEDKDSFRIWLFRQSISKTDKYLKDNPMIDKDTIEAIDQQHPQDIQNVGKMPGDAISFGLLVSAMQQLEPSHQNGVIAATILSGISPDKKAQILGMNRNMFLQLQLESLEALHHVIYSSSSADQAGSVQ